MALSGCAKAMVFAALRFVERCPKPSSSCGNPALLSGPGSDAPIALAAQSGKAVQVEDLRESPAYRNGDPLPVAAVEVAGIRTILSVPMLRTMSVSVQSHCLARKFAFSATSRSTCRQFRQAGGDRHRKCAPAPGTAPAHQRLDRVAGATNCDLGSAGGDQFVSGELAPVFHKMLENATRVCGANFGTMNLWDGEKFNIVADHNIPAEFSAFRQRTPILPHPGTTLAALVETHQPPRLRT